MKNFDEWNDVKKSIDSKDINRDLFYHAREVWWCSLGQNVGAEADGKNEFFERPVLIIKKFNSEMVLAIPMTSKEKIGKYFLKVSHDKGDSYANLSQLKVISTKRLQRKIGMINEGDFNLAIKEIVAYLETSNPPFGGFSEAEATNIHSISDQNLLSNFNFVRIDKSNYLEYLDQLVKLDEEFNQLHIDNAYSQLLTPKQNSDIDFKKFIIEEIDSDEEYFYEIVMEKIVVEKEGCYGRGEKVIGYVLCFLKDKSDFYKENKVGYIDGVYVDENCRGKGLGRLLMNRAEEFCKLKEVNNISLSVKFKNVKAISLYKELGFMESDIIMYKSI